MSENSPIDELSRRLEQLTRDQQQVLIEVENLRKAIAALRKDETEPIKKSPEKTTPVEQPLPPIQKISIIEVPATQPAPKLPARPKTKTPLEEFIGTNLLNKIGIAVLIIGVAIGAQYAIEHDMLNPLARVVLGYATGVILMVLAIYLKPKYKNFSAVLLSGGIAVLYLMTFIAYSQYDMMDQWFAFLLMVIFTGFIVFASLNYDSQVIAIIGMVGAYAVPFLLSDGSGRVVILFSYIAMINAGILFLGFKRYWKVLYILAFAFTWLTFMAWGINLFGTHPSLTTELIFSTLYYLMFYGTILANKLLRGEALTKGDVSFVLMNSFTYFGLGYAVISDQPNGDLFLGLFTVLNAIPHFIVCYFIYTSTKQSRDIFMFAAGMVLMFLTIAVPVQLNGHWVTLLWAGEATLLFWLGRTKNYPGYEKLSYTLIILALGSLYHDWSQYYLMSADELYGYGNLYATVKAHHSLFLLNVMMLTSLLTCSAIGFIVKISRDSRYPSPLKPNYVGNDLLTKALPAIFLATLYFSFFFEVGNFWNQLFLDSQLPVHNFEGTAYIQDYDVLKFKSIWLIVYSAIFTIAVAIINIFKLKTVSLSWFTLGFGMLVAFALVTGGLNEARHLRISYMEQSDATYYTRTVAHLLIRYLIIGFAIALLWANNRTSKTLPESKELTIVERLFCHLIILIILSSELVSGLAVGNIAGTDKLALTILWGAYALGLILFGLIKNLQYIRIAAISLFGITLIKLFFYDMSGMTTIAKTIVLITLGALLLTASFLYNKFKKKADEENK